jgi:hypothetical protein
MVYSKLSWVEAVAAAAATTYNGMQGHLVTISSQAENEHVASLIGSASVWLGMRRGAYDVWAWETGYTHEAAIPSFWGSGEPSYSAGDCAQMDSGASMTWMEASCSQSRYYVIIESLLIASQFESSLLFLFFKVIIPYHHFINKVITNYDHYLFDDHNFSTTV